MANKDLVKRAFSVTANLLPQQKPASDLAQQSPPPTPPSPPHSPRPDAPTPPVAAALEPLPAAVSRAIPVSPTPEAGLVRTPAASPKTGPGSMLAFMTEQSEVHREVVRLRERVSEFDGAEPTRRLDPHDIVASKWANRDESHFDTEAFKRLKQEIAGAGGNIQPIKVRPVANAPVGSPRWEIVYGHRRHRACLELGMPVLALIQTDMQDADLFIEMERENREREDLSAWEQGVMYMRALEQGLFPSAKQLAAAIDRDMSNISRAMALAKLPAEVVRAFGSPLNLQFRWATPLKDAHQRDPEALLHAARALIASNEKKAPAEVFALLTARASTSDPGREGATEWHDADGQRIAQMRADRKGRVTLAFEVPMEASQQRKLAKLIDGFLGRKG